MYKNKRAHLPIYAAQHARIRPFSKLHNGIAQRVFVRPFCKLTKQHRVAFNKHKLQHVLHIQRAYKTTRVSPCGPVAFVQAASSVRPLVLTYNWFKHF